ncbi:MAG TPA: hypothetical protein CFH84_02795 [Sulfurimonas sp. UBA12504]|nr:MAG TPA: hypothetical protein CFH84_02795 [Sulfurimonas sp. UBA12504]
MLHDMQDLQFDEEKKEIFENFFNVNNTYYTQVITIISYLVEDQRKDDEISLLVDLIIETNNNYIAECTFLQKRIKKYVTKKIV